MVSEGAVVQSLTPSTPPKSAFLTHNWGHPGKINGKDRKDNCLMEFMYAMKTLTARFVLVVVEEALDVSCWTGVFAMLVGSHCTSTSAPVWWGRLGTRPWLHWWRPFAMCEARTALLYT